ncbi:MAG: alpha/beta fold hydrolase [Rubrobacter sp.]|jgi:polyhydroxyalkanoate synthase|nr:alpha/beta fold hydrolase [Rubrobacter sp.]
MASMSKVNEVSERFTKASTDSIGCSLGPMKINNYDDPVTIRARKYATGTHVLLEEVGVETSATPREVVWTRGKAELYRYRRPEETANGGIEGRRPVPILLTYGFVLKPYIFDLVPGNSLVEYLVGEGFDVYMLDFGISDAGDAGLSLEDFVLDYMHGSVQKIREISGAEEVTLFGQSQGGTLSAMYAALFPESTKNLVLLSAPTDFAPRHPEPLGMWAFMSRTSGAYFDPAIVPKFFGNLPTDLAAQVINMAASMQTRAFGAVARGFGGSSGIYDAALRDIRERAERDVSLRSWLAASEWVDDAAPFPGETLRRWVKDFYQQNRLVKGEVELRGHRVDLSNIECSVLNVSGKGDYVVPPSQTKATTDLARSTDKESVSLDAGHIGMFVGPGAEELWPRMRDWLAPRSGQ